MLTAVYLWCLVHEKVVRAAAPTGIAAANIDEPGTDVSASTIHALFELDGELNSKLDFSKLDDAKVAILLKLQVLLLDEVSMIDEPAWTSVAGLLSLIDHSRRPTAMDESALGIGNMHIILFGDFKQDGFVFNFTFTLLYTPSSKSKPMLQLPPATSKAPFIRSIAVRDEFEFRVLRQNRRVIKGDNCTEERKKEIEEFHGILMDVSMGIASERVKKFIIRAYVRGALSANTAEETELEGNTAVFTKRRYRDKWNRTVVQALDCCMDWNRLQKLSSNIKEN